MLLRIEASSAIPVYRQIVDQVRYQIASGLLQPGDKLPSVRDLARQLPANQNTLLKAYDQLSQAGLISRRQGDGTYVEDVRTTIRKSERVRQLAGILAQAAAQAVQFQIDRDELHDLLDREMDAVRKEVVE